MRRLASYFTVSLMVCGTMFAQQAKNEPLNKVWLQNDLDGVKFLVRLTPLENNSIPELKKRFEAITENTSWFDETNLGFGAQRIKLNMGLGYTTIYIDYLLFLIALFMTRSEPMLAKKWPFPSMGWPSSKSGKTTAGRPLSRRTMS